MIFRIALPFFIIFFNIVYSIVKQFFCNHCTTVIGFVKWTAKVLLIGKFE